MCSQSSDQVHDVPGLVALLAPYSGPQSHVLIEEAQAMPGQGTRSTFTIGVGFGVWLGILATLRLAHTRVRPGMWKRALGLGKEASRLRAMQRRPTAEVLANIRAKRATLTNERS